MKKIFKKIVAKNSLSKPELEMVLIKQDKLVATNPFSLLEVDRSLFSNSPNEHKLAVLDDRNPTKQDIMLSPDDLGLKFGILNKVPIDISSASLFPKYEVLLPSSVELDSYVSFTCNAQYLANLVQAMSDTFGNSKDKEITLYVSDQKNLIIKRADTLATGVITPITHTAREVR